MMTMIMMVMKMMINYYFCCCCYPLNIITVIDTRKRCIVLLD